MMVFDLYCPSELVKEVTSFKLEPGVDVNLEVMGSNPKRGTIINYNEYIISINYFSLITEILVETALDKWRQLMLQSGGKN